MTDAPRAFMLVALLAVGVMVAARAAGKRRGIGGTYVERTEDGEGRLRGWNEPSVTRGPIHRPTYFHKGWFYTLFGPPDLIARWRRWVASDGAGKVAVSVTQSDPGSIDFRWIAEGQDFHLPEWLWPGEMQQHLPEGWI